MPFLIALKRKTHPLRGFLRAKTREHYLVQRQAQRIARRSVDCDNSALYGAVVVPAKNRGRDRVAAHSRKTNAREDKYKSVEHWREGRIGETRKNGSKRRPCENEDYRLARRLVGEGKVETNATGKENRRP